MAQVAASNASYMGREAAVSSFVNGAMSLAFFGFVFGWNELVPVRGVGNYAFDYLIQSFAVTFFSCFFPTLLLGKAVRAGKVVARKTPPTLLANLTASILKGVAAAILLGAPLALVLDFAGMEVMKLYPALGAKITYGAVLGWFMTRISLSKLLD